MPEAGWSTSTSRRSASSGRATPRRDSWSTLFQVTGLDGRAVPLEEMPAGVAFVERRPAQGGLSITGLDGVRRAIAVTAFPLFAHADEFVGIVAIFWEAPDAEAT